MTALRGLTWEQSKTNGAIATENTKLAGALLAWYSEYVNDFDVFDELILDKTHINALEIFGCVEEFSDDIERIISLINVDGSILLRRHMMAA